MGVKLLADLQAKGFTLAVVGDGLKVSPASRLTPAMRDAIKANKPALVKQLTPMTAADEAKICRTIERDQGLRAGSLQLYAREDLPAGREFQGLRRGRPC
jgi:hypothetical protein